MEAGGRGDGDRARVIEFWRAVELFSPQKVDRPSRERRMYRVRAGELLPWEPGHELEREKLDEHRVWRHVVYVGVYSLESMFTLLERVLPPDEESFEERPLGDSAMAAFIVSQDGRPLVGSQVLSTTAWATGQTLDPGPDDPAWLSGFQAAQDRFAEAFDRITATLVGSDRNPEIEDANENVGGRRMADRETLAECGAEAARIVGLESELRDVEIRVQSERVMKRDTDRLVEHDFLNSFIAEDLQTVAWHVGRGELGPALREYMRADEELTGREQLDVLRRPEVAAPFTRPEAVPLGRWPSRPEQPLALGQQLAVNAALGMLDDGAGIFAVNGPPGTGKTTMLRDVVAGLLVERARRLAELRDPRDAFTDTRLHWKGGDWTRTVNVLRPELTGFEIVVASNNNGAVDNVTVEIPAAKAIDAASREEAARTDYFAGIATALLGADKRQRETAPRAGEPDEQAWALIAARLGNKRNRGSFVHGCWYQKPNDDENADANRRPVAAGLNHILAVHRDHPPAQTWTDAVADFRLALDAAAAIRDERVRIYEAHERHAATGRGLGAVRDRRNAARQRRAEADDELRLASDAVDALDAERRRRLGVRTDHHQFRPRLLALRARREWRDRDRALAGEITDVETRLSALHEQLAHARSHSRLTGDEVSACERQLAEHERELAALSTTLDRAREQLGDRFPDRSWWLQDRERRERAAPWTDPPWNHARSQLLFAALRLHKAFTAHAARQMRQNLQAAVDVVAGDAPSDLDEAEALAAWQSLFIVVPVVSTTFASFARLFGHLGAEALGWLLIDEAGQATPQSATGALWRARRAIVVGDPRQLEPIHTLPFTVEQAVRVHHDIDEQWLPSAMSVQRRCDRLNPIGTMLGGDPEPIWVGAPLSVHRRCDPPMLEIANTIAYDQMMIDATDRSEAERFRTEHPSLPDSKWIDVPSQTSQGHWVPEEGQQLDRILAHLDRITFDMSKVMVIAPFRDVANQVRDRARRYRGLVAGTIHTAQGKEADIVILVLGSDPKRHGARQWAAAKPNLLNVAVSRAKRRLYVIGDRRAWMTQRQFDTLAHHLDTHRASPGEHPRGSRPTPLDTPIAGNPHRNQR